MDMMATTEYQAMNAYELARLADCGTPDALDSAGARWLEHVQSAAREAFDWADAPGELDEVVWEVADGVVPVYTHERWTVFVDLAAYQEDLDELGSEYGSDLTGAAGGALYIIADRLGRALFAEWTEEHDADA